MTTKSEILDIAQDLVQTRSYQGFSFQDIADALGLRKASLYHHFGSKEALALALLRRHRERFRSWTCAIDNEPPDTQLKDYIRNFGDILGAGQKLCPGGAFVPGWGKLSDRVQREVTGLLVDQEQWLVKLIRTGIDHGYFRPENGSPRTQARWILSTLQGALLLSRTDGSEQMFGHVMDGLRGAILARHQPSTALSPA
ncbi:MAG: TetR/AcrR family transcriptional regulator [Aquisalimonadaceae bacterium]